MQRVYFKESNSNSYLAIKAEPLILIFDTHVYMNSCVKSKKAHIISLQTNVVYSMQ